MSIKVEATDGDRITQVYPFNVYNPSTNSDIEINMIAGAAVIIESLPTDSLETSHYVCLTENFGSQRRPTIECAGIRVNNLSRRITLISTKHDENGQYYTDEIKYIQIEKTPGGLQAEAPVQIGTNRRPCRITII